jgi:1,4-dihydroxy-2-naphthoyl-CoA hydrolase
MADAPEPITSAPEDPAFSIEDANRAIAEGRMGELARKIELEWVEMTPERVVARIPAQTNTQPYGILHGGATAALCETISSVGAALRAGPDQIVVGIELNVNHIRSVREGFVTGTGTPLHSGRTTAVWDVRVEDEEGWLVAVSRLTLAVRRQG